MSRLYLAACLFVFTTANAASFDLYDDNPNWKKASAEEIAYALEQYDASSAPAALTALEPGIAEMRRRIALHGRGEPRYRLLLLELLETKLHYERQVAFAGRPQMPDEAYAFERSRPAYAAANHELTEALQKYPDNVGILRFAIDSSLPVTDDKQAEFKLVSRLVRLDKSDFLAHAMLVRHRYAEGDIRGARHESIRMLDKMLALNDPALALAPVYYSVRDLSSDLRNAGDHCAELSSALEASFAMLPQEFHTYGDHRSTPGPFKNLEDEKHKLGVVRQMIRSMRKDLSESSCGDPA